MKRLCLLAVLLVAFASCVRDDQSSTVAGNAAGCSEDSHPADPSPTASPEGVEFATGKVILEGEEGSVLLDAEIADLPEQQQQGLMNRTSLPDCSGMVFVFFEETTGSFWMKDTLIPLSIAFFDVDGKIVRILDMEPCEADPCPLYDPEASYVGALEVNQGAFDDWGIEEGDSIRVVHDARDDLQ